MNMSLSKLQNILQDREVWHAAVHGVAELDMTEWLNSNKYIRQMDQMSSGHFG